MKATRESVVTAELERWDLGGWAPGAGDTTGTHVGDNSNDSDAEACGAVDATL
jgi:hypothetical protein